MVPKRSYFVGVAERLLFFSSLDVLDVVTLILTQKPHGHNDDPGTRGYPSAVAYATSRGPVPAQRTLPPQLYPLRLCVSY